MNGDDTKLKESLQRVIERRIQENKSRTCLPACPSASPQDVDQIQHDLLLTPKNWNICKGVLLYRPWRALKRFELFMFLLTSKGNIVDKYGRTLKIQSQGHYVSFKLGHHLRGNGVIEDSQGRTTWEKDQYECLCLTDEGRIELYEICSGAFKPYKELHPDNWANEIEQWDSIVDVAITRGSILGLKTDGTINIATTLKVDPRDRLGRGTLDQLHTWRGIICIDSSDYGFIALDALGNIRSTFLLPPYIAPQPPLNQFVDICLIADIVFAKSNNDCWYYLVYKNRNEQHWTLFAESTPILKKVRDYNHKHNLVTISSKGKLTRWSISGSRNYPIFKSWEINAQDVVDVVPNIDEVVYGEYADSKEVGAILDCEYVIHADGTVQPIFSTTPKASLRVFEDDFDILSRCNQLVNLRKRLFDSANEKKNKRRQQQEWESEGRCKHCGGEFKGLFRKRCSQCGKEKDYSN